MNTEEFKLEMLEMYRKYGVITERIQVYNGYADDIALLTKKLDDLSVSIESKFNALEDRLNSQAISIQGLHDCHSQVDKKLNTHSVHTASRFDRFDEHIDDCKSAIKGLECTNHRLHEKINVCLMDSATKEEVSSLKSSHAEVIKSLNAQSKIASDQIDQIKTDLSVIKSQKTAIDNSFERIDKRADLLHEEYSSRFNNLSSSIQALNQAIPTSIAQVTRLIETKTSELNAKIDGLPSIDKVAKDIDDQLKIVTMDSRNISLRFGNIEQSMKIIDRKTENAGLRLSAIENANKI